MGQFSSLIGRACVYSPPPALGERSHRCLARRLVAVRRRAILMMPKGERPQPRRSLWRARGSHDSANHDPVREHVVIVITPLAGGTKSRCTLRISSWLISSKNLDLRLRSALFCRLHRAVVLGGSLC